MNAESASTQSLTSTPRSGRTAATDGNRGLAPFVARHIGPSSQQIEFMLAQIGCDSLDQLCHEVVPSDIRQTTLPELPAAASESAALQQLRQLARRNKTVKSLIGMGWHETLMPAAIRRNILENPAWYTAYTPYQSEISQGRLTMLLNFQQMIMELTEMEIANASLLDEATAAAEAMLLCRRTNAGTKQKFFIDAAAHPQTISVVKTRARWLNIPTVVGHYSEMPDSGLFAALLQYPATDGGLPDIDSFCENCRSIGTLSVVVADPLALAVLRAPGAAGADVVVGSTQRFGLPMAGGGPHAGYIATRRCYSRTLPGRLVGISRDRTGRQALRLSLQTREQHIRREKATSNICTAQVLPAILSAAYALWHGATGLQQLADELHQRCRSLARQLLERGYMLRHREFFDTLRLSVDEPEKLLKLAAAQGYNLRRYDDGDIGISIGETVDEADIKRLVKLFPERSLIIQAAIGGRIGIPDTLRRSGDCLRHPVFEQYKSETQLMRYLRSLSDRDISLERSMIALGSCTMKLNAAIEMEPISWPEFANMHPAAPATQLLGYRQLVEQLSGMLCDLTGFAAVSVQPNAGSQGEYAGLIAIRRYHAAMGQQQRDVCLIPASAHGTNPASASMAGLQCVIVNCNRYGDVDLADLEKKASLHSDRLAACMLTYPSTHGVFEPGVRQLCQMIHRFGGQVYMDGANLNAMLRLVNPAELGFDVCHFNLHKTFCIPHGGGGPGVGPVAVAAHLEPWLPADPLTPHENIDSVSAAPWGSAGILPISWMYMRLMGGAGLQYCSEVAILSANYIARRLDSSFPVLFTGKKGRVAHECIIDLRPLRQRSGVTEEDVAKRLIDFGFHAPTMSFPVAGTLMIEPTESEDLEEIDRFCEALLCIRSEIEDICEGKISVEDSPLRHAPHTAEALAVEKWPHLYSRSQAVYPLPWLRTAKYWPPVTRIDNVYGDRNLCCGWSPGPDADYSRTDDCTQR